MRLMKGALRSTVRRPAARSSYNHRLNDDPPRGGSQEPWGDIPELALFFLSDVAALDGPLGFTAAAMRQLRQHCWSGGVRELRRVVEVAASVCDGAVLDEMTVAFALKTGASERSVYHTDNIRRARIPADTYLTLDELDALQAI